MFSQKINKKIKGGKIFTHGGIVIIALFLLLGIIFVFIEKSGKIDAYFEKKFPIFPIAKIPEIKKYKIGFIVDAHAKSTKRGEIKLESKIPLTSFVSEINNNFNPDFVVDGGDLIDGTNRIGARSLRDYNAFSKIFETIEAPKYKVLGNHELRGMTRKEWIRLNKQEKSYYYFDYADLRIIIFDSNMPISQDFSMVKEYEKELLWLKDVLKNSEGKRKIIFTHHPFIPIFTKAMPLAKINEFNKIASEYKVKAVFSGHVEVPYYERITGVDYFVVPGFYRSKATGMIWSGSFSEINIGIKNTVRLFYKENENDVDYKKLTIPSEEYEKAKKEIVKKVNFMTPTD